MRNLPISLISAACLLAPAAAAASVEGVSGTINYRATATFSDGSSADRLYSVTVADLDGDGVADEGWLRAMCTNQVLTGLSFYSVKSPRDAASGMASGKRMHKPFTIIKVVDSSSPLFGKTGGGGGGGGAVGSTLSWDLVQGKGSRVDHSRASDASAGKGADGKTMAQDSWTTATLKEGSPNLCADG